MDTASAAPLYPLPCAPIFQHRLWGTRSLGDWVGGALPEAKKAWDPDFKKRERMKAMLEPGLPGCSVHLGGATSMDVTRPGIDKAHGIAKLRDILGVGIGDALFLGGNDYPAKQAGVLSIGVRDPQETKRVIETILACQS